MTWTRRVGLRHGVETTVEHAGKVGDPPVVSLHGLGGERSQALGLVAEERARVALDFRAHGDAFPVGPLDLLSFQAFSDDVADALDQLGLTQPLLFVGVSMGAGVALRFALDHPHRVRALVLIRPAWLSEPDPPHLRVFAEIAQLLQSLPVGDARHAFRESPIYRNVAAASRPMAASLLEQFDRPMAVARAAVLERMPASTPLPSLDALARISAPALVVACDQDPVHPIRLALILHQSLACSEYIEVPSKAESAEAYRRGVVNAVESLCRRAGPS